MDVRLEDLRFERDGRVVLDVPSLLLRGNRTTAVLGPNGAGKTTLLRLLASLERPTRGRILADGAPAAERLRRNVAYVFQEQVFLRQSVLDNLELGLALRGVHEPERNARISEAARLLRITHLLDRRADKLSGGEGRRVSLARALCLRSPLVLLDEPLAGLDPPTYTRLLDELPRLLEAFKATTVFVTHDHHEALRVGQDLVVLVDGRVHAAGGKREVFLNPRHPVVAEILGYTVLARNGGRVAVPRGALKPGPGPVEFSMIVDDLLDLVDHRQIVGRVGDVRVHVIYPPGGDAPYPGEHLLIHAERVCEIE